MKNNETIKRIITSLFLISLLILTFFYTYILLISLILISIISWIEFNSLITKIFDKDKINVSFLRFLIKLLSLIYLTFFSALIFEGMTTNDIKNYMIFLFLICICSDIGGLIFGKIFKGKKLTIISPNKTISGSIGSFILSLVLVPFFYFIFD